jgi:dihydroflavonol-4-reductase
MTVVVTGATGHVGNNLVRALLAQGRTVRVLLHDQTPSPRSLAGLQVERVSADVRDLATLQAGFAGASVVYHLAAQISIASRTDPLLDAVNVRGTANVLRAAEECGVRRVVHMSSVHALSALPEDEPIDETRPLVEEQGALPYDRSKADGERAVQAAVERGLDCVIVSPAAVLGRHDYGPSLQGAGLLAMMRNRAPLAVAGAYNWVDVRDVVAGALAAEQRGRTGERYLLSGHVCTLRELATHLAQQTGARSPLVTLPRALLWLALPFVALAARLRGSRPLYTRNALQILGSNCDFRCDKARRELGFTPRPLLETIADTVAFYREVGYL